MSAGQTESEGDLQERRRVLATTICAPVASVIAKYACHPIDTIKSKVQARASALHSLSDYRLGHSVELVRETWRREGVRGFFRGVTLSAFGSIVAFSAYMTAYERAKAAMGRQEFFRRHEWANHLCSGFVAEFFSCIFWLPIDIIKERMQVQSEVKIYEYAGPREAVRKIHASEGIIGLYRALGATLVFFGPTSAIFFVCYEKLKATVPADPANLTLGEGMVLSAVSGAVSGFLTTPLEMVKLRMQIQRADRARKGGELQETLYGYRNIFHGLSVAYKKEGFLGLYKGAGLRVLFTVPIFSLSMGLTEYFRNLALRHRLADAFL